MISTLFSKALAAGVVLALSLNASSASASRKLPKQPQLPKPPGPTQPLPGLPGGPAFPPLPTIPPPGKGNPKGGPEVPFPLSITLPFPWSQIEGIYKVVTSDGSEILFSFNVQTDAGGHQYLRVLQIDSVSGDLIAEGVGISVESDKLVRAAMKSKSGGAYMLFVGSYKNTNQYVIAGQTAKSVMVLTVRPFTDLMGSADVQVIVQKISNTPYASSDDCSTNSDSGSGAQ